MAIRTVIVAIFAIFAINVFAQTTKIEPPRGRGGNVHNPKPPTPNPGPSLTAEQMYLKGEAAFNAQNYKGALDWYRKAALKNYAPAQYKLGYCYEMGRGVGRNVTEAMKWYGKAAENGMGEAEQAIARLQQPAAPPQPRYSPSEMYNRGIMAYKENNFEEAVDWFRQAADLGNTNAQCYLGFCYERGEGVDKDQEEAVKLYRCAAEEGNPTAQYNLGSCYENGRGVNQIYHEAINWYTKAAEQGYQSAQKALERLARHGIE